MSEAPPHHCYTLPVNRPFALVPRSDDQVPCFMLVEITFLDLMISVITDSIYIHISQYRYIPYKHLCTVLWTKWYVSCNLETVLYMSPHFSLIDHSCSIL